MQSIPPPKCKCGIPARLNRVKRSKDGGDSSRAIGKYFFFCSKKRDDETQCRFARPAEAELDKKRRVEKRVEKRSEKEGATNKSNATKNTTSNQICKFFAKGSCKKGDKCEFSHDVEPKKAPLQKNEKTNGDAKGKSSRKVAKHDEDHEGDENESSDDDSSSSDDSSDSSSDDSGENDEDGGSKKNGSEEISDKNASDAKAKSEIESSDESDSSD